jgi:hypothetical protein
MGDIALHLSEMRKLLDGLKEDIALEQFGPEFREHMQAVWLVLEKAGRITLEVRHTHTNLAEAVDAFEIHPHRESNIDAVGGRFSVYEAVTGRSA